MTWVAIANNLDNTKLVTFLEYKFSHPAESLHGRGLEGLEAWCLYEYIIVQLLFERKIGPNFFFIYRIFMSHIYLTVFNN